MDRASGKLTEEVMEVEATSANIGVQSRPDHEESGLHLWIPFAL